jgi:hypothetical protein
VHVTDGIIIEWDIPIEMDDGTQWRAEILRPIGPRPYPVLFSQYRYAKAASFQTGYAATWNRLADEYPEVSRNTTNKYQNFEFVALTGILTDQLRTGYLCCVLIDTELTADGTRHYGFGRGV